MPIIILATEQPGVVQPTAPPAPQAVPPTPQPQQAPTIVSQPSAPVAPQTPAPTAESATQLVSEWVGANWDQQRAIVERLFRLKPDDIADAIVAAYQKTKSEDLINLMFTAPSTSSGTVLGWVKAKLPENSKDDAQHIIWTTMQNFDFRTRYLGYLGNSVNFKAKGGQERNSIDPQILAYVMQKVKPYYDFLKSPNSQRSRRIDDDLLDASTPDYQKVWEQYKRDEWNDDSSGQRVEKAKSWWVAKLKELARNGAVVSERLYQPMLDNVPEAFKKSVPPPAFDPATVATATKYIKNKTRVFSGVSESNPDWLPVLASYLSDNGIPVTKQAKRISDIIFPRLSQLPPFEKWVEEKLAKTGNAADALRPRMDNKLWYPAAVKTLEANNVDPKLWKTKDAPYYLSSEMLGYKVTEEYIKHAQDRLLGKQHSIGSPIGEEGDRMYDVEDKRARPQEVERTVDEESIPVVGEDTKDAKQLITPGSPKFKEAVQYIVGKLYPQEIDISGDEARKRRVMNAIGKMYSQMQWVADPKQMQKYKDNNNKLDLQTKRSLLPLLDEPLEFRHSSDNEIYSPEQRYALALGELVKDLSAYISNPQNAQELQARFGLSPARVAAFKGMLRMAAFSLISRHILEG
jgi:hypothetical protein